jgi:uncharacterized protein YerC
MREQVAGLLDSGLTNRAIGDEVGCSASTVSDIRTAASPRRMLSRAAPRLATRVQRLYDEGHTTAQVSVKLGISRNAISRLGQVARLTTRVAQMKRVDSRRMIAKAISDVTYLVGRMRDEYQLLSPVEIDAAELDEWDAQATAAKQAIGYWVRSVRKTLRDRDRHGNSADQ